MASTVWKGQLSFGLVCLPVKLSCAARGETIGFNQLRKSDLSRVGQKLYAKADGRDVERSEIVKGYEYEKDRYLVVTDEEIKAAAPASSKNVEISQFVDSTAVDAVYLESSYYVAPDKGGEKAYALLYSALKAAAKVAIAKVVMSNREHIVVIRPGRRGLLMHTLFYQDEVRAADEFQTDTDAVSKVELDMARHLIDALTGEWDPTQYRDAYQDNILALIEAKRAGAVPAAVSAPAAVAQVVDITAALRASLAMVKAPESKAALAAPKQKGKKAKVA